MATPTSLLTLDTFVERRTVTIDGQAYELLTYDALPVVDFVRHDRLKARFRDAWDTSTSENFTTAAATEASTVLDQLVRIVLKAPDDVQARLTDAQRLTVYQKFLEPPPPAAHTDSTQTRRDDKQEEAGSTGRIEIADRARSGDMGIGYTVVERHADE